MYLSTKSTKSMSTKFLTDKMISFSDVPHIFPLYRQSSTLFCLYFASLTTCIYLAVILYVILNSLLQIHKNIASKKMCTHFENYAYLSQWNVILSQVQVSFTSNEYLNNSLLIVFSNPVEAHVWQTVDYIF